MNLVNTFHDIVQLSNQDLMQENANLDGRSPMGQVTRFASESSRAYAEEFLLSEQTKEYMVQNIMYPHDLDYYATGTTTCCQIPLGKILSQGFNTGHGHMRQPQCIKSAMALTSIIFQANQNQQHGGQSVAMLDYDLAPYVNKTYEKNKKLVSDIHPNATHEYVRTKAWSLTKRDTYQACEAFIHNSNSMNSRGGGQVPFISINYGTDTSPEGRLVVEQLLLATQAGLGKGETPIFPIQIFKLKNGVNFNEEDKNYDLYQLALRTSAKRLFPNFSFIDAPHNYQYYNGTPESEICYMGCRTRVISNRHGEDSAIGRGNLSFTSINLVRLALLSEGNLTAFYWHLQDAMRATKDQLLERYEFQCKKLAQDFSFLYRQGVWKDSETLAPDEEVRKVLKHGTLSIGFIGLAEALKVMVGKHHGESDEAQEIGRAIIHFMRTYVNEQSNAYDLNFSLIATPAEGLSGKFVKRDREKYGELEGVTDREFYTNSFHIPVYYKLPAVEKIKREAAYHELCNAGHITYIEIDGDVKNNIQALDAIVRAMAHYGVGYGSINHPIDRCMSCNYDGKVEDTCPKCASDDISRIRRITGYLVGGMHRWNSAKQAEEQARVKHGYLF